MKNLIIAILSVLLLVAFIPARRGTTSIVHPDTTWKPYIVVLRNEYGQETSKWIKGYYNPKPDTTIPVGDRILIDLGSPYWNLTSGALATTSPQPDGRYWNSLPTPAGTLGTNSLDTLYNVFVDTFGKAVPKMIINTFNSATQWFNGAGINYTGDSTGAGDYPSSATMDSWINNVAAGKNINILLPTGTYSIKFWGSRLATTPLTMIALGTDTLSYNATNNVTYTNAATFTSVVSDGINYTNFSFFPSSSSVGTGFAYIGVIDIKRTN